MVFCHVGPHPLFPPADPENPDWVNLSNVIGGDQYWTPVSTFTNLKKPNSFLYQFLAEPAAGDHRYLASQRTDNTSTTPTRLRRVFDVPARLKRALLNPAEKQERCQSQGAQRSTVWNFNPRYTPTGTDRRRGQHRRARRPIAGLSSISVRTPEQWKRLHNTVIWFPVEQSPFLVEDPPRRTRSIGGLQEQYRIPYLVSYFTYRSKSTGESIAAPMRLADIPAGRAKLAGEISARPAGAAGVYRKLCRMPLKRKQPAGFALSFSRDWAKSSPGQVRRKRHPAASDGLRGLGGFPKDPRLSRLREAGSPIRREPHKQVMRTHFLRITSSPRISA